MYDQIEIIKELLERKINLTKKLLTIQLEILEKVEFGENVLKSLDQIKEFERSKLQLDILFVVEYEKLFKINNIEKLEELDKETKSKFEGIKKQVELIQVLDEHALLQASQINEIESRLKEVANTTEKLSKYRRK